MKPKKRTHTSITGKTLFGTDAEFYLAFSLPYERWTCADGREVLVNGFGEPLWDRRPKGEAVPAALYDRIVDAIYRERIYTDADRHYEKRAAAKHALENFRAGVPIWVKRDVHNTAIGGGSVQDHRRRSA
jgi:hypothetical protein